MVTYSILPHTLGFVSTHNFRQRNKLVPVNVEHSYTSQFFKFIDRILDTPNRAGSYFRKEMYW